MNLFNNIIFNPLLLDHFKFGMFDHALYTKYIAVFGYDPYFLNELKPVGGKFVIMFGGSFIANEILLNQLLTIPPHASTMMLLTTHPLNPDLALRIADTTPFGFTPQYISHNIYYFVEPFPPLGLENSFIQPITSSRIGFPVLEYFLKEFKFIENCIYNPDAISVKENVGILNKIEVNTFFSNLKSTNIIVKEISEY